MRQLGLLVLGMLLLCAPVFASNLTITDLHVSVTYPAPYDRYSDTRNDNAQDLGDGADIDVDIYPGSIVEFSFDVKNTFDNDDDISIENIVVTLTAEELDDGSDIEAESEEFDLDAEEEFKARITFTVPEKVEDMEYTITLEAEGDTDNDTTETAETSYTITVKKDSRDLKLVATSITPNTVSCNREVRLLGTIANVGRLADDNAAIEISSPALGIYALKDGIELSEDPFIDENEYTYSLPFTIAQSVASGTYDVTFKAIYEETFALHTVTLPLTINSCGASAPITNDEPAQPSEEQTKEEAQEEPSTPISSDSQEIPSTTTTDSSTQVPASTQTPAATEQAPITSSVEKSATSGTAFKMVFVLANVLLLAVLGTIAWLLISRKK